MNPALVPDAGQACTRDDGLLRREDARLLRGAGCFVADLQPPGLLHAVFVRSAHAHARVLALHTDEARALPGVVAVFTSADFPGLAMPPVNALIQPLQLPAGALLGDGLARAVGAPLALVVASSRAAAQAAADGVWVEVEELPPVADVQAAAGSGDDPARAAPIAQVAFSQGRLPTSAPTARVHIRLPRVAPSPLEPRAALLQWTPGAAPADDQLLATLSTQTPERARQMLANSLGLPPAQVQVVAPEVGGAFGGKAAIGCEELLLAHAARRLRAPLRWLATRMEDLASAPQGRASVAQGAIWLDAQGGMAAIEARFDFNLGHWLTYSAVVPARNAARIVPGPYRVANVASMAACHASNAAAVGIYRGAGRPEAAILLERLVDEAARQAGIDPLALRRRQVWPDYALPTALPGGDRLDAMDLPGLLDKAAALFGYADWRTQQAQRRAAGALLGVGMALYVEPCGQGSESATLTAHPNGRYTLATGATAQGQGRETAYARIAAPVLGCTEANITVLHGDTRSCPPGTGALASRSTAIGGSAVLCAAQQLRAQLDAGATRPCEVALVHHAQHEAWAAGCVMVAVQIDADTGELAILDLAWVDDAGTVVHPTLLKGQLLGGLAQGLGQALLERLVIDDQGQLLTGSLMDYALPRAADVPPVRLAAHNTPSAANPLGAKGVGEAGCIGLPAALLNAVDDALAPRGQRAPDFPLSAARLWRVMQTPPVESPP